MEFRKGSWRLITSIEAAQQWEAALKTQCRPLLVDGEKPQDDRKVYTLRYYLFLNPSAQHRIDQHDALFILDDFYHATISFHYDLRPDAGWCMIDIGERSVYYMHCNLWICERHNNETIVMPPGYVPRCMRCGETLTKLRGPIYANIRATMVHLEQGYAVRKVQEAAATYAP